MDEMIAFCGLYCGACSFKVAYEENNRSHLRTMPEKYREYENAPLEFCPGCRLDTDEGCKIRNCARSRGLAHCGLCSEFLCSELRGFNDDGIPHHSEVIKNLEHLNQVGEQAWLHEQKKRWSCTCGAKRSWYLKECHHCGERFK